MKTSKLSICAITLVLAACGGGGRGTGTYQLGEIAIPSLSGFDLGTVDSAAGKYYLTAAGSKAIDVIDISHSDAVVGPLAAGSFAGDHTVGFDHSHNGPNGVVLVPGSPTLIYAGDVNSVKVVNPATNAVVRSISVGGSSGLRVDEGCFDPDDGIVMFTSPEQSPPFITFISTASQTVIATYVYGAGASIGLEQCVYDHASHSFLINNDGNTTNHPDGEVNVFTAASVVAHAPVISNSFATAGCGPTGLALGPNNDLLVGCIGVPGSPQISLILDRNTGAVLATVPFGGEDAVAYDPTSNKYFLAALFHQTSGIAINPGDPTAPASSSSLGVIDAGSRKLIASLPTGNGAHSVSVDPVTQQVFVPHAGGAPGSAFAVPGVTVFSAN